MRSSTFGLDWIRRQLLLFALALLAAIAVGMAIMRFTPGLNTATAEVTPGDAPARVVAQKLDDGRVEVGIQYQQRGQWQATQLPSARFVPADADAGVPLYSSSVGVPAYRPPFSAAATWIGTEGLFDFPLHCTINHGAQADYFWEAANHASVEAAYSARLNVRIFSDPDGAEQAAAIRQCAADGTTVISATLADPDAVAGALREAAAAGVHIMTYNSQPADRVNVGAALHLALDDSRGGELVGERLNADGASGTVWCLIHERENTGLQERCHSLEATYAGGDVVRLNVADDLGATMAQLPDADIGAIVTLNTNTTLAVAGGLDQAGRDDIQLIGFGGSPAMLGPILSGRITMVVWDQPDLQGMLIAHLQGLPYLLVTGQPFLEIGGAVILIEPVIYDLERIQALVGSLSPTQYEALLGLAGLGP